jgi:tetratricopeptide (TPR) repeat protein
MSGMAVLAAALALAGARPARGGEAPAGGGLGAARARYLAGEYDEAGKALRPLADAGSWDAGEVLARLHIETGRLEEADALARKLREAHPDDADVLVLAGETALVRGRTTEAEEFLRKALALDTDSRRARTFLKRIYDLSGRDKDSEKIVDWFWDLNQSQIRKTGKLAAEDYRYVAEAVKDFDLDSRKKAFRHFMRAYRADPDLHEAYLGAGDLAIEVYDWMRAERSFRLLLERNARHPLAHLGLARVYLAASAMKKAEEEARKALEVNASLPGAHLILAQLHLVDDRMAEAREEIDAALETNAADPEALALDATWRFASGDETGFEAVVKKALALYPRHTGVYTGAASVLERRRRFPAALEQYRKARKLDPDGWEGYYGEGMTLVRMGEEEAGYAALETAFERNPFNTWAFNTLSALDRDFKHGELVRRETEHWVVKVFWADREGVPPEVVDPQDPVLGEHIEEMLERVWQEETERFGFTPRGPDEMKRKVLFEVFAEHDDFSARTAGIPNLGALGATLGQIVTMPSPLWGVGRKNPFRWEAVARHEFAHVITLQLTDYRIPRWFTEGVSCLVEGDPQNSYDGLLARAAGEGEIATLAELNSLFTRPETPADVALGYYQAALVVEYLVKAYGFECVKKACALYGRGRSNEAVMREITGLAPGDLDRRIKRYIELHLEKTRAWSTPGPKEVERLKARLDAEPKDAAARARLAEGMLSARQYDEAHEHATRAVRDSGEAGPAKALVILGLVSKMRDRDDAAALAAFERAVEADGDHYLARLYLGLAERATGKDSAARTLEKAHELNPRFARPVHIFDAPPLAELVVGMLRAQGEDERARLVAERASRANPTDWKSSLFAGEAHLKDSRPDEAKKWLARALSVNPFAAEAQLGFARASMQLAESKRGDRRDAELDHAIRACRAAAALAERDPAGHEGLARALAARGRKEEALAAIETLRQFDPAAATRLERELAKELD